MKKSLITASAFVLILLAYGIITSNWGRVYYISGGLGLTCIGITLFTYLDKIILGNKGTLLSKDGRKEKRTEVIKQYLAGSGIILIAAILGFLLK